MDLVVNHTWVKQQSTETLRAAGTLKVTVSEPSKAYQFHWGNRATQTGPLYFHEPTETWNKHGMLGRLIVKVIKRSGNDVCARATHVGENG